jgi:AcrR family transcriptional regulator
MARHFRQQVEDGILDEAAALFERHGYKQTSIQAIADALGYSKAGLLHHFRSKEALHDAVLQRCRTLSRLVHDQVVDMPLGPGRDQRAVEMLVDMALAQPGILAFLLHSAASQDSPAPTGELADISAEVNALFGVDPSTDRERLIRVTGALAALAVLSVGALRAGEATAWRPHIIATSVDALGHDKGS